MLLCLYQFLIHILEPIIYIPLRLFEILTKQPSRLGHCLPAEENVIWLHAASLGEVNALKPLIKNLIERYNAEKILLTTMTGTGMTAAQAFDNTIDVCYVPIDLPGCLNRFFKLKKPQLIVLMETEFWPQMLLQAHKRNIPVIIINARLSLNSLTNYQKTYDFWKSPFKAIKQVNAQSEKDGKRFRSLGFSQIQNAGNLKFALKLPEFSADQIRQKFNINKNDFVLTIGSSRPGEEQMLLNLLNELNQAIPNLKIIIAPRHLKRLPEIKTILKGYKFKFLADQKPSDQFDILIIDEIGLLTQIYSFSDLVIIGGSFFDFGGHNPLEAAYYAKPIIMGKFHHSCQNSVDILTQNKAIIISDFDHLAADIIELYQNPNHRDTLGNNAKAVLAKNAEALEINLNTISEFLS